MNNKIEILKKQKEKENITIQKVINNFELDLRLFDRETAERTALIYLDYMKPWDIAILRKKFKEQFNFII